MTISVLLAVLSTAALVGVWGILFGLIAEDRFVRARGWAIAALALAVGIAVAGEWHHSDAGRVVSAWLVLVGAWLIWSAQRVVNCAEVDTDLVATDRPAL
jgi:hypothetical protein